MEQAIPFSADLFDDEPTQQRPKPAEHELLSDAKRKGASTQGKASPKQDTTLGSDS